MNILLIHNRYQQPGGEDTVVLQEQTLLQEAGHHVATYLRSNDEVRQYSGLQRIRLAQRSVWARDTKRECHRILAQSRPDIVHVHNTFVMVSPSIYSCCKEANIPVIQTLHNYRLLCPASTFFRSGRPCEDCVSHGLSRSVLHGCYQDSRLTTAVLSTILQAHRWRGTWEREINCYIALTNFARNKFVEGGLPAHKIRVKPNCVHPDPGRRDNTGKYALFVGRLSPEKGLGTLIRAWKRVGRHIPLKIAGSGPLRGELEAEAARSGLSNIAFMGLLSREQTLATMKQARFLIFPSEWYESFPMTLLEAYACGVPVLGSDVGVMPEIIQNGCTGLLFKAGDAEQAAEKVAWAWEHATNMDRMGDQARQKYLSSYTGAANYSSLMNIYSAAIANVAAE